MVMLFSIACQQPVKLPLGLDASFGQQGLQLYGPKDVYDSIYQSIREDIGKAKIITEAFYQTELKSDPIFIYCHTAEQFERYGSEIPFIVMNHSKDGGYIILNGPRNPNEKALAHEWVHIEYYIRVGEQANESTPTWFKEGKALQVDQSGRYHPDSLLQYGLTPDSLPDLSGYVSVMELIDAPRPEIIRRLRIAHQQFANWYTPERLEYLMDEQVRGMSFAEAFEKSSKL